MMTPELMSSVVRTVTLFLIAQIRKFYRIFYLKASGASIVLSKYIERYIELDFILW